MLISGTAQPKAKFCTAQWLCFNHLLNPTQNYACCSNFNHISTHLLQDLTYHLSKMIVGQMQISEQTLCKWRLNATAEYAHYTSDINAQFTKAGANHVNCAVSIALNAFYMRCKLCFKSCCKTVEMVNCQK